jgi:hypothetical protein
MDQANRPPSEAAITDALPAGAEPDAATESAVDSAEAGKTAEPTEPEEEGQEGLAGTIVSHLQAIAEPVASAVDRLMKAVSPEPLANLYEIHPEAREASPRELGLRFVPIEEIRGTAVAGIAQRGSDFLPLRPFRGENWQMRWRRIREANQQLAPLPPIDAVKFGSGYWVVDGHNRVAGALADNAAGLDAMVTELVPLDGRASDRPTSLLPFIGEVHGLRAAAAGHRPAMGMRLSELASSDEPEASTPHTDADSDFDPGEVSDSELADEPVVPTDLADPEVGQA